LYSSVVKYANTFLLRSSSALRLERIGSVLFTNKYYTAARNLPPSMASEGRRPTIPKQAHKKRPSKARRAPAQKNARYPRLVEFPQAQGRTVDKVELNLDSDFHCISIRFQDETDLTFRADYSRWKDGEQEMLKRWPPVSTVGT